MLRLGLRDIKNATPESNRGHIVSQFVELWLRAQHSKEGHSRHQKTMRIPTPSHVDNPPRRLRQGSITASHLERQGMQCGWSRSCSRDEGSCGPEPKTDRHGRRIGEVQDI